MSKYDVTALGELLIDFTENGTSAQGNPVLEANPGGAPCNVLSMLNRLGHKTNFIGKIGKDMFGDQLEAALKEVGIGTDGLMKDDEVHTTLAFVHTAPDGDREFSFYRNPSADMLLDETEVRTIPFKEGDILHFCSVDLCDAPVRLAHVVAIERARSAGALVSFDPNLRYNLWDSAEELLRIVREFLPLADIVKVSDEELYDITGIDDEKKAVKSLFKGEVRLVFVTKGKGGAAAYTRDAEAWEPTDLSSPVVDTTGAGDSFIGTILSMVLDKGISLSREELSEMLKTANRAATIVVSREGAIPAMPTREELFSEERA